MANGGKPYNKDCGDRLPSVGKELARSHLVGNSCEGLLPGPLVMLSLWVLTGVPEYQGVKDTAEHLSRNSAIKTDCRQVSVQMSLPTD